MSHEVYARATHALFQNTYGRLEDRDQIKVVQLFDKLLKAGHLTHVDDLRRLCRDAGYDSGTADDIGHLYDTLRLIRLELEKPGAFDYWPDKLLCPILMSHQEGESTEASR